MMGVRVPPPPLLAPPQVFLRVVLGARRVAGILQLHRVQAAQVAVTVQVYVLLAVLQAVSPVVCRLNSSA